MSKQRKKQPSRRSQSRRPQRLRPVQIIEYEITTEPIHDPDYRRLPRRVQATMDQLYGEVHTHPHEAIPKIQKLIEKYPHIPNLYNYLSAAYSRTGQIKKSEAVVLQNYRRNPDYLFSRINYAEICLHKGEYEKIPEIFDHKFDLKLLYPERNRFHVSEVVNFMGVIGIYFARTGKREAAQKYYDIIKKIGPDDPATKMLRKELHTTFRQRILRSLINLTKKSRRKH